MGFSFASAIVIEVKDHFKIRSFANKNTEEKRAAKFRRGKSDDLIQRGNFAKLLDYELRDIENEFDYKYRRASENVSKYVAWLNFREVDGFVMFDVPNYNSAERDIFYYILECFCEKENTKNDVYSL